MFASFNIFFCVMYDGSLSFSQENDLYISDYMDDDNDMTDDSSEEDENIVCIAHTQTHTHCACVTHTRACGIDSVRVFFLGRSLCIKCGWIMDQ